MKKCILLHTNSVSHCVTYTALPTTYTMSNPLIWSMAVATMIFIIIHDIYINWRVCVYHKAWVLCIYENIHSFLLTTF